jgi:hypothetical protein
VAASGKLRGLILSLVALLGFSAFSSCAFADSAQLIIHRSPRFGTRPWLRVWIDATEFEAVAVGHDFTAPIAPGRHVISVIDSDNMWHFSPTKRVLQVHADRTYEFTAIWRNDRVVLEERR